MSDVLHLRRHMAENPAAFDMVRNLWRARMQARISASPIHRDPLGRFTPKGITA